MRSTINRKSLAVMYALGLVWVVAMVGAAVVLVQPMAMLYETVGIESAAFAVVATTALAILVASSVTVGVALILRATADHQKVTHRA
jgi:predicted metal-binding membrane protein